MDDPEVSGVHGDRVRVEGPAEEGGVVRVLRNDVLDKERERPAALALQFAKEGAELGKLLALGALATGGRRSLGSGCNPGTVGRPSAGSASCGSGRAGRAGR